MVCFTESELQQHEELIIARALAEKDLQWKRRIGLDCGGHSCFYAFEKTGMRHNGPCSCNPKRTKEEHDQLYQAYQQLMEKAVRFAEAYHNAHLSNWIDLVAEDRAEEMAAKDPVYVEARDFVKENRSQRS